MLRGVGWVPVDASEVAKDPDKREYFFGAHDENRVEFTSGRDLILQPQQRGELLKWMVKLLAPLRGASLIIICLIPNRGEDE
jgi:hypothetical protein